MSKLAPSTILVIMGSVRAGRRCPHIAEWVLSLADKSDELACEIVDLRDWHLPASDEPGIPAKGAYTQDHTRTWSTRVAGADHLYKEWGGKPLVIVTYGGHGGGKCAEQLRQVAAGLNLRPVDAMPRITVARELIESDARQSLEELEPFEASVQQALAELSGMLAGAGSAA